MIIPSYREIRGRVEAFNPYHGWKRVLFEDNKTEDIYSIRQISQPISELEELYIKSNGKFLTMNFSSKVSTNLYKTIGLEAVLTIQSTEIFRILEIVKSKILDWALKLEKDGILGENMTFINKEKQIASETNYHTFIHNMNQSQIQQGTDRSVQEVRLGIDTEELNEIITLVDKYLRVHNLEEESQRIISNELDVVNTELTEVTPSKRVIEASLSSVGRVIGTASESAFTDKITSLINTFLGNS